MADCDKPAFSEAGGRDVINSPVELQGNCTKLQTLSAGVHDSTGTLLFSISSG